MRQLPPYLKETDAWSTVIFADPLGIPLARLLSYTPIHPNVVTVASLLPALACVYFFWRGDPLSLIWGALLFQFSWILDCTDGKLAKMTGKQTKLGAKLDPVIDLVRKLFALLALSWGVYRQFGTTWLLWTTGGVLFHYGIHFFAHHTPPRISQSKIPQVLPERRIIRRVGQLYTAYDEQFLILFIAPLLAWLVEHLPTYMIWGASFLYGTNALAIKIKMRRSR